MYDTPFIWQYYFAVTYIDYSTGEYKHDTGVVPGDTYTDAMGTIGEAYDDTAIISVSLSAENDISNNTVIKRDGSIILFSSRTVEEGELDIECKNN